MSNRELGEVMVTGLEGEELVKQYGLGAMKALMDELEPPLDDDAGEVPMLRRLGANGHVGTPLSEPSLSPKSSTLALTLEQHRLAKQFTVPRFRHDILRLPRELQRLYFEAEAKEVHAQEHVYKLMTRVKRSTLPPGTTVYRGTMAYKLKSPSEMLKNGGLRARGCVVATKMRELLTLFEMYSPTVSIISIRIMCSVAVSLCLDWLKWDAHFAFANSRRSSPIYMELYKGHEEPLAILPGQEVSCEESADQGDVVLEVLGNLQGAPDASRIWNETLSHELVSMQKFRRMVEGDCELYIRFQQGEDGTGEMIVLCVHVDDVLSADTPGSRAAIRTFKGKHEAVKYKVKDGKLREVKEAMLNTPTPEAPQYTSEERATNGPVSKRLPFDFEELNGALGMNFHISRTTVVLTMKDYVVKTCAQLFVGKSPWEVGSPNTPMEKGEWLTTHDCPRTPEQHAVFDQKLRDLPYDNFDFLVWLGKLQYAAHCLMYPVAVAASNCSRVASQGGSVQGLRMLIRACRWAFGSAGWGFSVTYRIQNKEDVWYMNRLLVSVDASPPSKKVTPAQMQFDRKLGCARIGMIATINGGAVAYATFLTRGTVASAPSAELFGVHFASRQIRTYLKLLSYFGEHGFFVPHFELLAPVILQQDCRSAQFMVHTPKSNYDAQADLLQMENVRQDTKQGLLRVIDSRSGEMASDLLTKATVGKDFSDGVKMSTGGMKWRPIDVEKAEYKAPKCRKCYAEWLVHERDERVDCMVGVCQKCGARTQS
jgi:hypothetical protein